MRRHEGLTLAQQRLDASIAASRANGLDPNHATLEPLGSSEALPEWAEAIRRWVPPDDLAAPGNDQRRFVVEPLIAEGLTGFLVAAGDTGKTVLQLRLGVSIATGRPFLGMPVQQGTFALLSADDSQADLEAAKALVAAALDLSSDERDLVRVKLRVHSLQGLGGSPRHFAAMTREGVLSTGLESAILRALDGITDLRVIGLDTLRQFAGGSSNDEQVVVATIAGAQQLARQTGAAVILAHHTGKANYRDGIEDQYCGSGSAAIADNARFVLLLQRASWLDVEQKMRRTGREQGEPFVLTSTRGSLLVKPPPPVYLHRAGYLLERIEGTVMTQDEVLDARDRRILEAVRRGPAESKRQILVQVGGKQAAVFAALDALVDRGHLSPPGSPSGSRSYVITTGGARLLEALP